MAGAMTEIKDEIRSNTIVVMGIRGLFTFLYCVCVIFLLLFLYSIFSFLYALYGHFVFYICHKMNALEEFNRR
jgi:hypothetical protein